jgi:hypothetical protein
MQDLNVGELNLITQTNFDFQVILVVAIFFLAFVILIFLALQIMRKYLSQNRYFKHKVFLVKLPKEKPEDDKKDFSAQHLIEEIAKGETIFASIGGLKAQKGFKYWFFGRDDHFSFEIVALSNKIAFYVVAPDKDARYIEQQIHANYPEAVIEEVEDYNIFKPDSQVMAAYLKTKRDFIFPIKTYRGMETDPMNSLVNVLSKLDKDESLVIQYVVRSAIGSWHGRIRKVVENINKIGSISKGIEMTNSSSKFLKSLGPVFDSLFRTKKTEHLT